MRVPAMASASSTRMKSHLPIRVTARDNIFTTESSEPFVRMSGNLELDDFRWLLSWDGSMNFYEAFQVFWQIKPTMDVEASQQVSFENWKRLWQDSDAGSENGAVLQNIQWASEWRLEKSLDELQLADLALDSTDGVDNPALNGATDGASVGANTSLLPAIQDSSPPVSSVSSE